MMVDNGWGNGDPKVRLSQLQQALQREALRGTQDPLYGYYTLGKTKGADWDWASDRVFRRGPVAA